MHLFSLRSIGLWGPLVLIVCAAVWFLTMRPQSTVDIDGLYRLNKNYPVQTELYDTYRTQSAAIVMLGNSITYGVQWNELLGRSDIVNRGIGSDVVSGYLHRLDDIVRLHPQLCFVMGGINDLYAEVPVDRVFHDYSAVIDSLQGHGIIPIIQSTLYVNPRWPRAAEKNPFVRDLNTHLVQFAASRGIRFVDLNVLMSSGGILRDELTYDGLHLRAQGYVLWRTEIEKVLREYGM